MRRQPARHQCGKFRRRPRSLLPKSPAGWFCHLASAQQSPSGPPPQLWQELRSSKPNWGKTPAHREHKDPQPTQASSATQGSHLHRLSTSRPQASGENDRHGYGQQRASRRHDPRHPLWRIPSQSRTEKTALYLESNQDGQTLMSAQLQPHHHAHAHQQ